MPQEECLPSILGQWIMKTSRQHRSTLQCKLPACYLTGIRLRRTRLLIVHQAPGTRRAFRCQTATLHGSAVRALHVRVVTTVAVAVGMNSTGAHPPISMRAHRSTATDSEADPDRPGSLTNTLSLALGLGSSPDGAASSLSLLGFLVGLASPIA